MVNTLYHLEHLRRGFDKLSGDFQWERQKCKDEELQVLLDDDPTQKMLTSTND
jgi:hypothetical protein